MKPHIIVSHRYKEMLEDLAGKHSDVDSYSSNEHLLWMLNEIISDNMSDTKANRWLGYVQGVLYMSGVIDVDTERNETRDIFNGK